MAAYVPAIVWIISAFICFYIANARNVKLTISWNLIVVILGPLAIPLMFLVKPRQKMKPAKY